MWWIVVITVGLSIASCVINLISSKENAGYRFWVLLMLVLYCIVMWFACMHKYC
ncbi:hypothetical protein [Clostridium frigidicarnis]|nr:hypothetical protein [Clostridium frigidicarnis]